MGGYEHEVDEDIDEFFDKDSLKLQLELSVQMAEVSRSVSEWHRRMTAEKLNQSGQPVDMSKYPIGTKVFFYRPPSKQEADIKGRRAKHIDHYVGPARVTKHIGTRSKGYWNVTAQKTQGWRSRPHHTAKSCAWYANPC